MLALQAQDLRQACWALGVRTKGATSASVADAFRAREIVRTWCLRGTLHIVPSEDLRWLVRLLGPVNLARAALRFRRLGIDQADVASARAAIERALPGTTMTREGLFAALESAGQPTSGQRGVHLLFYLSQLGLLCQAGDRFAWTDDWVPERGVLEGDAALGELANRYVAGHGPASANDLAYWTGLGKREAKRAFDLVKPAEAEAAPVPSVMLLPGYDEYLLGYPHRAFCVHPEHASRVVPGGNGVFLPMVVLDGRVRGTFRGVKRGGQATLVVRPFEAPEPRFWPALEIAARAYGAFTGEAVEVALESPADA